MAWCLITSLHPPTIPLSQIDSPAQLANLLVNATDAAEEIESEDVSLTVGLLGRVTNSTEDLQQEEVSSQIIYIYIYIYIYIQYIYIYKYIFIIIYINYNIHL